MTIPSQLGFISFAGMFISLILFVLFGQTTVRKLRKKEETKHLLGLDFISGWDIFNVAQALALPRSITMILERGPLSALEAKTSEILPHTTKFDRFLAHCFYWSSISSTLSMIILIVLDALGVFSS